MDIDLATALLGGMAPQAFMRRHWQKKPLLVRQALPVAELGLTREVLAALANRDDVESRLVARSDGGGWRLRHGPFPARALPPRRRPGWTLLVQGVDLHMDTARALLERFRFVPDARLDDVMVSYASDGGGVGPHFDSYDVFLLQVQGTRRWRIGRLRDDTLQAGLPLKILARFEAEEEWLLAPGDMLYLPPRWAHDGTAVGGDCITASIGFRAPGATETAFEVVQRALDAVERPVVDALYRDARQAATDSPGRIPEALQAFAAQAVERWLRRPDALAIGLGEWLSEPKPSVAFESAEIVDASRGIRLDRRTRMLHDARHVYINGDAHRAGGRDATLMRRLADRRWLAAAEVAVLSAEAQELVLQWMEDGWVLPAEA